MYYVIFARDLPNTLEKRLAVREQHLARLKQLQAENRLLTAGPNPAIDDENPGKLVLLVQPLLHNSQTYKQQRIGRHKILM